MRDILEAADHISSRLTSLDLGSLATDEDAEAAPKLSAALWARHAEVPWKRAIALRNRVTHDYFGLDWTILRKTGSEDIPALRRQIAAILKSDFSQ
ncbi:MAG: DUF86 domain-containing protein [Acidobacteria bacterium]|nr:DUF86 domain-containing protein [Acidobacteriota bacterium]